MAEYKSPVPITEVLDLLKIPIPSTSRSSFYMPCPICDSASGKRKQEKHLNVNIEDDVWNCPKCCTGGATVHFYAFFAHGIDPSELKRDKELRKQMYKEISDKSGVIDFKAFEKKRVDIPRIDFPPTDIDERDFTYRCLLRNLPLSEAHMQNLKKRGMKESTIQKNGYGSTALVGLNKIPQELRMQDACNLQGVPGFYKKDGQWTLCKQNPGIMIPVREVPEDFSNGCLGKIQGIQIRYDDEIKPGLRYMWLSTRDMEFGSGAEVWTHFVGYPEKTIWLTEGPLKGDIANMFLDEPFICVPGVNCLSHLEDQLKRLMDFGVRHVKTAFDMDYKTKPTVQKAYNNLIELLSGLGLTYERVTWDERFKGIDDYLYGVYLKKTDREAYEKLLAKMTEKK